MEQVLELITQKLEAMINAGDPDPICSKHKAITALFSYALWQEQYGQHKVSDVCLHAARASKQWSFIWHHIRQLHITVLLNEESPVSMKQTFILMSPHLPWNYCLDYHWVQLWAAAVSAVPYTDEIGQSVVATLLCIAPNNSLQPHIPIHMWSWLNKSPVLPPFCTGRSQGKSPSVAQIVQGLGSIETLTSYLLLIWSEWEALQDASRMEALVREEFSGIRMGYYRKELLQHLDHVLGQLELGSEYLQQHDPFLDRYGVQERQDQYRQLKEVLLEVDREAIDLLICKSSRLIILSDLLNSCGQVKDITQCLCVQCLFYLCNFLSGRFVNFSIPIKSPNFGTYPSIMICVLYSIYTEGY